MASKNHRKNRVAYKRMNRPVKAGIMDKVAATEYLREAKDGKG